MLELVRHIQEHGTHRFRCSKTGEPRKRQRFFPTAGAGDPYQLYHFLSSDIRRMQFFAQILQSMNEIQSDFVTFFFTFFKHVMKVY